MKNILKRLLSFCGVLPYIQVVKEKYFPTKYYIQSRKNDIKYINFYSEFIENEDLCFDIGAHKGHRTNIFLNLKARVVAVEPQYELYKYLKIKFKNQIQAINCGIGSKPGSATFFINEYSSLSTFSESWITESFNERFGNAKWKDKKKIKIMTLDQLIQKYGRPEFCKIDVEGYESEVLKGLSEPISYISFEFMTPENSNLVSECLSLVKSISPNCCINYSLEDTMEFVWDNWIEIDSAIIKLETDVINKSLWGDIYVKMDVSSFISGGNRVSFANTPK